MASRRSSMHKEHYTPPWTNTSIVGVAGASGSGKTSLAMAITSALNLPWVVILSTDAFYKPLTPEQSKLAFRNEFDFDAPESIDFDLLVERLRDLKAGKKVEVPIYVFEKHGRAEKTNTIYSPHVLILEGIFALHDQRILDMLDLKIYAEADPDLCLSRRLVRDVRERGRDIEGCIKQWFSFVKPNFHRYVETQKNVADIIVPRGIQNTVAIELVTDHVRKVLKQKSKLHREELQRLGESTEDEPPSPNIVVLEEKPQVKGINTIILNPETDREDFIFYFDRMATLLLERASDTITYVSKIVTTPIQYTYRGLEAQGIVSAVVLLRGGSMFEPALRRVFPDCYLGRVLIQTDDRTSEPQLHFRYLPANIADHSRVLVLDPQMASGGAALMAIRVLIDHGVNEERIVFVTYFAGRKGLARLMAVYSDITVVVCRVGDDSEERWLEAKYLGS